MVRKSKISGSSKAKTEVGRRDKSHPKLIKKKKKHIMMNLKGSERTVSITILRTQQKLSSCQDL